MLQVSIVSPNSAKIKAKVTKTMKAGYSSSMPRKIITAFTDELFQ